MNKLSVDTKILWLLFFSCYSNKAKTTKQQTNKILGVLFVFIGKLLVFSPGPPAVLLVANLVEVRQIHPDGSSDATLVEEPRGTITALDYDPIQKYVRKGFQLVFYLLVFISNIWSENKIEDD